MCALPLLVAGAQAGPGFGWHTPVVGGHSGTSVGRAAIRGFFTVASPSPVAYGERISLSETRGTVRPAPSWRDLERGAATTRPDHEPNIHTNGQHCTTHRHTSLPLSLLPTGVPQLPLCLLAGALSGTAQACLCLPQEFCDS